MPEEYTELEETMPKKLYLEEGQTLIEDDWEEFYNEFNGDFDTEIDYDIEIEID